MLAFFVGMIFGACVSFLVIGFLSVVAEDDERRYLQQKEEERRVKQKEYIRGQPDGERYY